MTLTIRGVPDNVHAALVYDAKEHGQSLQAFLLDVLRQRARFSHNRHILAEVESDLSLGGGAGPDAPDAASVLDEARKDAR